MKLSAPLYHLKRKAKLLSRAENIPLHDALDRWAAAHWLGGGENLRTKDIALLHEGPEQFLTMMVLDGVLERAKELGATILQDVMQVGDFGWMSVLRDPTGATLALWKAEPRK